MAIENNVLIDEINLNSFDFWETFLLLPQKKTEEKENFKIKWVAAACISMRIMWMKMNGHKRLAKYVKEFFHTLYESPRYILLDTHVSCYVGNVHVINKLVFCLFTKKHMIQMKTKTVLREIYSDECTLRWIEK